VTPKSQGNPPPADRKLITPQRAAVILGLDECSADPGLVVRRMARRGELVAVRVGRWTLIDAQSVHEFIQAGREVSRARGGA